MWLIIKSYQIETHLIPLKKIVLDASNGKIKSDYHVRLKSDKTFSEDDAVITLEIKQLNQSIELLMTRLDEVIK